MSAARFGFQAQSVYRLQKPSFLHLAKQRLSFMIASLSLFAFVMGNMVGQHGWYSFWKTVLGKDDDVLLAFVGTVSPIDKIPDYAEWAKYGGSKQLHTFNQIPEQVLHPLPLYDQEQLTNGTAPLLAMQSYSTLWAGGYNSPSGSHAGADIDAPRGTPVRSVANGVIERVSLDTTGFGHFVMIRHPNVPDASVAGGKTTLRSSYAHMDSLLVQVGQVVYKGQQIGTVGNTGLVFGATGYHLYFAIDKDNAPYHPYWPFTSDEVKQSGLSYVQAVNSTRFQGRLYEYTLNPMAFVQQYASYAPSPVIVAEQSASVSSSIPVSPSVLFLSPTDRLRQITADRLRVRIARGGRSTQRVVKIPSEHVVGSVQPTPPSPVSPAVTKTVSADLSSGDPVINGSNTDVDHLRIEHSGKLSRTWQRVTITALNSQGGIVLSPSFAGRLYVLPDFGEAEIRPSELSPLDFQDGVAVVKILPLTQSKPVFIVTRGAFNAVSEPLVPSR